MSQLKIRAKDQCKYDAVSLGEVMLRIDPVDVPTARARTARIWHGGGETNVAEGLSYCFGFTTAVVTALVDDGIGRNIENQMREAGVDTSLIIWFNNKAQGRFSTDQKGSLMNGINFTFRGKGVIPSKTEYYRAHSAIRELKPGDVDWDTIMSQTRAFHCGGIYTLLSPTSSDMALEAFTTAGKYGVFRSFDLNYRSKVEPDRDKARSINRKIVPHTDFLVGNQADFCDTLGYEINAVATDATFDTWLEAYADMLRKVALDFPNLKIIGTQLRAALSADRINWGAVLYDVLGSLPRGLASEVTYTLLRDHNVHIVIYMVHMTHHGNDATYPSILPSRGSYEDAQVSGSCEVPRPPDTIDHMGTHDVSAVHEPIDVHLHSGI